MSTEQPKRLTRNAARCGECGEAVEVHDDYVVSLGLASGRRTKIAKRNLVRRYRLIGGPR